MSKRIIVIDDEPEVRQLVQATLQTKGHEVYCAAGGEEGLEEASRETPDLIICDLMMPRVSGLEVLKRLRRDEELSRVPVIIISELGDESRPPDFWIQTLGVDDYVQKPFEPLELLGRVEFIFRRDTYVSTRGTADGENGGAQPLGPEGSETEMPVDLRDASPREVVEAFVESWNRQDFATEYQSMAEEMIGDMPLHQYVSRRRKTYMEEKGQGRRQQVASVEEEKVSGNVAKIVITREDVAEGNTTQRQETYTLKKTGKGWKIIGCKSTRSAPSGPNDK